MPTPARTALSPQLRRLYRGTGGADGVASAERSFVRSVRQHRSLGVPRMRRDVWAAACAGCATDVYRKYPCHTHRMRTFSACWTYSVASVRIEGPSLGCPSSHTTSAAHRSCGQRTRRFMRQLHQRTHASDVPGTPDHLPRFPLLQCAQLTSLWATGGGIRRGESGIQ